EPRPRRAPRISVVGPITAGQALRGAPARSKWARMDPQDLLAKLARAWARDQGSGVSIGERLRKGVHLLSETAAARLALRGCQDVGAGARLLGRARVENRGRITIGSGLVLRGPFLPVELLAGPRGKIE